eukprot:869628_1
MKRLKQNKRENELRENELRKKIVAAEVESEKRANALNAEQQKVSALRQQVEKDRIVILKSSKESEDLQQEILNLTDQLEKCTQIARETEETQIALKNEHKQDKIDMTKKYEAKENILQSEVNLLKEHKLRFDKQMLQLKENEKKSMNEIDNVIQSKIVLIKATSTEIDALRQRIRSFTANIEAHK